MSRVAASEGRLFVWYGTSVAQRRSTALGRDLVRPRNSFLAQGIKWT